MRTHFVGNEGAVYIFQDGEEQSLYFMNLTPMDEGVRLRRFQISITVDERKEDAFYNGAYWSICAINAKGEFPLYDDFILSRELIDHLKESV